MICLKSARRIGQNNMTICDLFIWIYDKLTHNTTRWYTSDSKIRGAYINHIGMGLAEDFSTCTPEVMAELEDMIDTRRKELLTK